MKSLQRVVVLSWLCHMHLQQVNKICRRHGQKLTGLTSGMQKWCTFSLTCPGLHHLLLTSPTVPPTSLQTLCLQSVCWAVSHSPAAMQHSASPLFLFDFRLQACYLLVISVQLNPWTSTIFTYIFLLPCFYTSPLHLVSVFDITLCITLEVHSPVPICKQLSYYSS